jgi:hypothetical protein
MLAMTKRTKKEMRKREREPLISKKCFIYVYVFFNSNPLVFSSFIRAFVHNVQLIFSVLILFSQPDSLCFKFIRVTNMAEKEVGAYPDPRQAIVLATGKRTWAVKMREGETAFYIPTWNTYKTPEAFYEDMKSTLNGTRIPLGKDSRYHEAIQKAFGAQNAELHVQGAQTTPWFYLQNHLKELTFLDGTILGNILNRKDTKSVLNVKDILTTSLRLMGDRFHMMRSYLNAVKVTPTSTFVDMYDKYNQLTTRKDDVTLPEVVLLLHAMVNESMFFPEVLYRTDVQFQTVTVLEWERMDTHVLGMIQRPVDGDELKPDMAIALALLLKVIELAQDLTITGVEPSERITWTNVMAWSRGKKEVGSVGWPNARFVYLRRLAYRLGSVLTEAFPNTGPHQDIKKAQATAGARLARLLQRASGDSKRRDTEMHQGSIVRYNRYGNPMGASLLPQTLPPDVKSIDVLTGEELEDLKRYWMDTTNRSHATTACNELVRLFNATFFNSGFEFGAMLHRFYLDNDVERNALDLWFNKLRLGYNENMLINEENATRVEYKQLEMALLCYFLGSRSFCHVFHRHRRLTEQDVLPEAASSRPADIVQNDIMNAAIRYTFNDYIVQATALFDTIVASLKQENAVQEIKDRDAYHGLMQSLRHTLRVTHDVMSNPFQASLAMLHDDIANQFRENVEKIRIDVLPMPDAITELSKTMSQLKVPSKTDMDTHYIVDLRYIWLVLCYDLHYPTLDQWKPEWHMTGLDTSTLHRLFQINRHDPTSIFGAAYNTLKPTDQDELNECLMSWTLYALLIRRKKDGRIQIQSRINHRQSLDVRPDSKQGPNYHDPPKGGECIEQWVNNCVRYVERLNHFFDYQDFYDIETYIHASMQDINAMQSGAFHRTTGSFFPNWMSYLLKVGSIYKWAVVNLVLANAKRREVYSQQVHVYYQNDTAAWVKAIKKIAAQVAKPIAEEVAEEHSNDAIARTKVQLAKFMHDQAEQATEAEANAPPSKVASVVVSPAASLVRSMQRSARIAPVAAASGARMSAAVAPPALSTENRPLPKKNAWDAYPSTESLVEQDQRKVRNLLATDDFDQDEHKYDTRPYQRSGIVNDDDHVRFDDESPEDEVLEAALEQSALGEIAIPMQHPAFAVFKKPKELNIADSSPRVESTRSASSVRSASSARRASSRGSEEDELNNGFRLSSSAGSSITPSSAAFARHSPFSAAFSSIRSSPGPISNDWGDNEENLPEDWRG